MKQELIGRSAFTLIPVLIFIGIIAVVMAMSLKKSENTRKITESESNQKIVSIKALSLYKELTSHLVANVTTHISVTPPTDLPLLDFEDIRRPMNLEPSIEANVRCVGQGTPFQPGVCQSNRSFDSFPKVMDLKLTYRDGSTKDTVVSVSGTIDMSPVSLGTFSNLLLGTQSPIFSTGVYAGNVGIYVASNVANPYISFMTPPGSRLDFLGSVSTSVPLDSLYYGSVPGVIEPAVATGDITFRNGISPSGAAPDGELQNIVSDLISNPNRIHSPAPGEVKNFPGIVDPVMGPEGWTTQTTYKFGYDLVLGGCKVTISETRVTGSDQQNFVYYDGPISNGSIFTTDASESVTVSPLDSNNNQAETCGEQFTVVSTNGTPIAFLSSFVNPAFNPLGLLNVQTVNAAFITYSDQPNNQGAIHLGPETVTLFGTPGSPVTLGSIMDGSYSVPQDPNNPEVQATSLRFDMSAVALVPNSPAVSLSDGLLHSNIPPSPLLGTLMINGGLTSYNYSTLAVMNQNGTRNSGFSNTQQNYVYNLAPGMASASITARLEGTTTNLRVTVASLADALAAAGLPWAIWVPGAPIDIPPGTPSLPSLEFD